MPIISALSFEIQQSIKSHNIEIKRSHINELIAALLGFRTFNSLKLSSYPVFIDSIDDHLNVELFEKRCGELNISPAVSPHFQKNISNHYFLYLTTEQLSKLVREALYDESLRNDILERLKKTFVEFPQFLIYPYLIAQLFSDCDNEFDERNKEMNYLYDRYLQGKEISPTWKSSLDNFIKEKARNHEYKENYIKYLKIAKDLGSFPAQLQLYEFGSDGYYFDENEIDKETGYYIYSNYPPSIEVDLAKRGDKECLKDIFNRIVCDRYDEFKKLTEDELIEVWIWQKFALFLGFDLAKGDYKAHAIHENGDYYDDDVGGPMYVVESGREDLILPKLSVEQKKLVDIEVNKLIQFYQNLDEFTFTRYIDDIF